MSLLFDRCSFEDVFSIWRDQLWPGRTSAIEARSAMRWLGGIDSELLKTTPSFWRARADGDGTVGVLSGHFGGIIEGSRAFRTRGLWVDGAYQKQGVGRALMTLALERARNENCTLIWTYPRESAFEFYKSMGFRQESPWADGNCYALRGLEAI